MKSLLVCFIINLSCLTWEMLTCVMCIKAWFPILHENYSFPLCLVLSFMNSFLHLPHFSFSGTSNSYITDLEPGGHYCYTPEPCCTKYVTLAPFWFSRDIELTPFWFSTDMINVLHFKCKNTWLNEADLELTSKNSEYMMTIATASDHGVQWNLVITRSLGPWNVPCYFRFLILSG